MRELERSNLLCERSRDKHGRKTANAANKRSVPNVPVFPPNVLVARISTTVYHNSQDDENLRQEAVSIYGVLASGETNIPQ